MTQDNEEIMHKLLALTSRVKEYGFSDESVKAYFIGMLDFIEIDTASIASADEKKDFALLRQEMLNGGHPSRIFRDLSPEYKDCIDSFQSYVGVAKTAKC